LRPVGDLYAQYRLTWFDAFSGLLLVGPPLAGLTLLIRWAMRFRRGRIPQ
jgi:hypothetical protein